MGNQESNFDEYSKYYDAFYREKDYALEADTCLEICKSYKISIDKICDIGCGSGKHSVHFLKKNIKVIGVEPSDSNLNGLDSLDNFKVIRQSASDFSLENNVDVAVSLFHVVSYFSTNDLLLKSLENIRSHIKKNGLFIFDFWYSPGVYNLKPETREKNVKLDDYEVTRIAHPTEKQIDSLVNVEYSFDVRSAASRQTFKEIHSMRHFSKNEIELALKIAGFELLEVRTWSGSEEPTNLNWDALCVARVT